MRSLLTALFFSTIALSTPVWASSSQTLSLGDTGVSLQFNEEQSKDSPTSRSVDVKLITEDQSYSVSLFYIGGNIADESETERAPISDQANMTLAILGSGREFPPYLYERINFHLIQHPNNPGKNSFEVFQYNEHMRSFGLKGGSILRTLFALTTSPKFLPYTTLTPSEDESKDKDEVFYQILANDDPVRRIPLQITSSEAQPDFKSLFEIQSMIFETLTPIIHNDEISAEAVSWSLFNDKLNLCFFRAADYSIPFKDDQSIDLFDQNGDLKVSKESLRESVLKSFSNREKQL